MLFNNNDGKPGDRILYKTKPNMILGCKKAIYGVILLIIILTLSPMAIKFIGGMQVYMISYVKLSLTRYAAIAFFVVILINVIYIIWQLVGWYSIEYTLTDTRIMIKSGVLSTKKNYMPYGTIQDVNTSQSIIAKLFNVGSVSVYSAYDNNQMELKNISRPSEIEEIIFSKIIGSRNFQAPPQRFPREEYSERIRSQEDDYLAGNEYYDEYEPITPITHERGYAPRRDYEYYPEDFTVSEPSRHRYEYEPYDGGYGNPSNSRPQDSYYNQVRDEYSYANDNYYQNNQQENYYEEVVEEYPQNDAEDMDVNTSQKAIRRHFDKFKK